MNLFKFIMDLTSFAGRLRHARERMGLSQQELARLVGTTQGTYHPWESGRKSKRIEPDQVTTIKLADILGVSLEWLIRGTGPRDCIALDNGAARVLGQYRLAQELGIQDRFVSTGELMVKEASRSYGKTAGKDRTTAGLKELSKKLGQDMAQAEPKKKIIKKTA